MAGAATLASPALDWLRHGATRFYSDAARAGAPEVRATLDACTLAVVALLGALALVALAAGPALPGGGILVALALVFATLNALFDYAAALAARASCRGPMPGSSRCAAC